MKIERRFPWLIAPSVLLCACSGGGGGTSPGVEVLSVVQDLTLDPDGTTTVITLDAAIATIDAANVEADGGQTALTAALVDDVVTVTWDARVTPSHEVRIVGKPGIDSSAVAVETSDDSEPTFTIASADQIAGLGGDTISVQFSGPRVIESEVEDDTNWTLEVSSVALDLGGSTFDFDAATQVLTITTGPLANLHASFTLAASDVHSVADVAVDAASVAGAATGDSTAPSLVSAEQNLSEDEFGRVVDFTFDEAMDPVFAADLAHFAASSPDLAIDISQPAEEVLRVTFNNPIVPGVDSIDLEDLVDAHGNTMADETAAISAGSTVANAFASDPELVTVSNAGSDYVTAEFDQALDPAVAEDAAHWELVIDPTGAATTIDLSTATLDFDLLSKTLTITLAGDLTTGDDFSFGADALDPPLDVDGEDFTGSFDGTIGGDSSGPAVVSAVQNRYVDPDGTTLEVTFDEDLDETSAETLGNWSVLGVNVTTATLLASGKSVRLELDQVAVPGDATLDVSGVADLAGNAMTAVSGHALTSTDLRDPEVVSATASAVEGADNDVVVVTLTDTMIESEVEDVANWTLESPIGTALDVTTSAVAWNASARTATLTLDGVDLQTDDDFLVEVTNARDIGGNFVAPGLGSGDVDAESVLPELVSAWVESAVSNHLHLRFSEPCQVLDDIAGLTEYVVRNSAGLAKGTPVSATTDSDDMGVELVFAFAVLAGSDTLDARGVLDLAGNPMFPVEDRAIEAEDSSEVGIDALASSATAVSGEENDVVVIELDRVPSPFGLLDPSHYTIELGGTPVDLSAASFAYDGATTITITLDGTGADNLTTGSIYDLELDQIQSAQGVDMSASATSVAVAGGDSTGPALPAGKARLDAADPTNSILIEMDEALDPTDAANTALFELNGAVNPDSVDLLGVRTVRATFSGGVAIGDTIDVTLHDLAGNLGVASRAIADQDAAGPLVVAVEGTAVSGAGGDLVTVEFNKPVDTASALSAGNYAVTNGSVAMVLTTAALSYDSATHTVTIELPAGQELDPDLDIDVQVSDVYDHAGLAIDPPAAIHGDVVGDSTAPGFEAAFANYRADATGLAIDLVFDEEVDEATATDLSAWSGSGGQTVDLIERRGERFYRLTLSAALANGETLDLVGLADLAGNAAGALSIAPGL